MTIPKLSFNTLTRGAKQFVVQLAFEIIISSEVISCSFTPFTIVFIPASFAGAERITFFAPASRCLLASSFVKKNPVDSTTISIFSFFQGSSRGSLFA